MNGTKAKITKGLSEVRYPAGKSLLDLVSVYADLTAVLLEGVQNAIDKNAKRVKVDVDLREKMFQISDNGDGASKDELDRALLEVNTSRKDPKKGDLGKWGRGMLAGVPISLQVTFTACEGGSEEEGYVRWVFNRSEILRMKDRVVVPFEVMSTLSFNLLGETEAHGVNEKGVSSVWWRARLRAEGIEGDRVKLRFNLDDFSRQLLGRYGRAMRRKGTRVQVRYIDSEGTTHFDRDVFATGYKGTPLEAYSAGRPECGRVQFRLYLAREKAGARSGQINVSTLGDPNRLPHDRFVKHARAEGILGTEVAEALSSGLFEGDIECEKIKLYVDRTRFELDDALVALCECIEEWFYKIGSRHYEQLYSSSRQERYQRIGELAIQSVEEMLRSPHFQHMYSFAMSGRTVDQSPDAPDPVAADTTSPTLIPRSPQPRGGGGRGGSSDSGGATDGTIDTGGPDVPPETTPVGDGDHGDPRETDEKNGEIGGAETDPTAPPGARKRKTIHGSSLEIKLRFGQLETTIETHRYESDKKILTLNTLHPHWTACEQSPVHHVQYVQAVVLVTLTLMPYERTSYVEELARAMSQRLDMEVYNILHLSRTIRRVRERDTATGAA